MIHYNNINVTVMNWHSMIMVSQVAQCYMLRMSVTLLRA